MGTGIGSARGVLPDEEFARTFEEHAQRVLRLAHLLGASDPEDVAQEAFAKLYAARERVEAGRVAAYLTTIVVNEVRGRHRRTLTARRHSPVQAVPDRWDPLEGRAESLAVVAALAELTDRQREIVVLRYWHDLPLAEIAQVVGVRPGTVKSNLSRAMDRLSRTLGEER